MTNSITNSSCFITQLREKIEYPSAGVLSKVLLKDNACQYTLFCLAGNTDISEHTSTRNATINVIEGRGLLTLSGEDITLQTGVFVFMPANARLIGMFEGVKDAQVWQEWQKAIAALCLVLVVAARDEDRAAVAV
ncbi:cupin domain-containing protein [Nostoc sp. ChiVER01]|uniref:cupin domain-containing protein n=1 Tax=Nostoc sp. ChiVER01 TaxID=3075382 RepID=UPI002AD3AB4A|nr:cupin domain-containing protein [Nostoc sp. ChiVER01]MDZ8225031.1 cupin domain-containing protein [Nostoc sp. ChiVER01]